MVKVVFKKTIFRKWNQNHSVWTVSSVAPVSFRINVSFDAVTSCFLNSISWSCLASDEGVQMPSIDTLWFINNPYWILFMKFLLYWQKFVFFTIFRLKMKTKKKVSFLWYFLSSRGSNRLRQNNRSINQWIELLLTKQMSMTCSWRVFDLWFLSGRIPN